MAVAASLPFHRHSLVQVGLDAGLVALAYYLAFELRFDGAVPQQHEDLFERTMGFAIVGGVFIFARFGFYRHETRCGTWRGYVRMAEAAVVATLALLAYVAVVQPTMFFDGERFTSANVPTGVLALYALLMLVFIGGSRSIVHALRKRPLHGRQTPR